VDLDSVTNLELLIIPDISGGHARASLAQLRIGSNTTTPNERSNQCPQDYRALGPNPRRLKLSTIVH